MERNGVDFMFLCFILVASLCFVTSENKFYNSRSRPKNAGVQYIQSEDVREIDISYLLDNECKFFIVEKTIFYACPKRPTRYPFLHREVFRDGGGHSDRGEVVSRSEKFKCPFPFGTHPHPKDCRKYYLCLFDKPQTMTCDSNKLYDEYDGECADKDTVDCGDRTGDVTTKGTTQDPGQKTSSAVKTTTKKGTTQAPDQKTTSSVKTTTKKVEKFKCPYTWGTYPNPNDCSQYYLCLFNKPSLKKCKPTELYDTKKEECRDEDKVDCGSRFNPREKTTKSLTTTAATSASPTERVTTTKEEIITSETYEESTSQPSSGDPSDQGATETSLTEDTESITEKFTSQEPAQSTEEPATTQDENSVTISQEPDITDSKSSTSTTAAPPTESVTTTKEEIITSETYEESTSQQSSGDPSDQDATETSLTDDTESITEKFTSQEPAQSTEEPATTEDENSVTTENDTPSKQSEAPEEETTLSSELGSSLPGDNTNADEKSTDGEEEIPYTTEEVSPSFQPESTVNNATSSEEQTSAQPETTEEEKITPQVSIDGKDISSPGGVDDTSLAASSEPPELFVCPRKKGNFPHKDCSLYYQCKAGSYMIEQCPSGTLFHSIFSMCNNEDTVDCGDRKRPDTDERSTMAPVSSASPTDLPMEETTADRETWSKFSKSSDSTDKTVDYTSSEISKTTSTSDYNTEKTDGTSDFDNNDFTSTESTENFETSFTSKTDFTMGIRSSTDYRTFGTSTGEEIVETSESQSTFTSSTKEIGDSTDDKTSAASTENYSTKDISTRISTSDYVTKEATTSADEENTETSPNHISQKSTSTYSTEATSDTHTTNDYSTEDTSYVNYSTQHELTGKTTTNFEDELSTQSSTDDNEQRSTSEATETTTHLITEELSTQSISDDNEHRSTSEATKTTRDLIKEEVSTQSTTDENEDQSTSEATEGETGDNSSEDQSTSFISETTYSDSQEQTTVDYTKVSIIGTDDASQVHSTGNIEETTSSGEGTNEISTKNIPTLRTGEPSITTAKDTFDRISTAGTTGEEIVNNLTSSELPSTSFTPGTTQPSTEEPHVSETTTTKAPDTTSHSPKEIIISTAQPKEVCQVTDNTCISDKDGNVFRCPKATGHFPHPWDTSKFLQCDSFRIHVFDCPAGLRFDPTNKICTWASAEKE